MTWCIERRISEIQCNLTTLWNNLSGSAAPTRGLFIPSQPLNSPLKSEGENSTFEITFET